MQAKFPYLQTVRSGDRATEFKQRCDGLGIKGVPVFHSVAWCRVWDIPVMKRFSIPGVEPEILPA